MQMARSKDVFSKKERSRIMSSIKSRDTKFELAFLKILSASVYPKGYRYRKHYAGAIGKPDVAFVERKIAIFLDSDFWHGRNLRKLAKKLKNDFWRKKIRRNVARDREVNRSLRRQGWRVMRFGSAEVLKSPEHAVRAIENRLRA